MKQHTIKLGLLLICGSIFHAAAQIPNVQYGNGSEPAQVMDIYLPSLDLGSITKVIVLIHGGAWGGGQKSDMNAWVPFMQAAFPTHAIVNMEYRLGTRASPGFPKQLEDIDLALSFLKSSFTQPVTFGLIGSSAGGHLSMLYGYSWDRQAKNVKVIVSHVGPTDLTDINYVNHPEIELFFDLVGPCRHAECPELYNATSPLTYVTAEATKTIGFYGNADPLVPSTQMPLLRERLDSLGVPNRFRVYAGGHGDWAWEDIEDMIAQITEFFNTHW